MERASNKHSPLVDEQLAAEARSLTGGSPVESRSQERRLHEDAGDEDDNTRLRGREDAGLSAAIGGATWPATSGPPPSLPAATPWSRSHARKVRRTTS